MFLITLRKIFQLPFRPDGFKSVSLGVTLALCGHAPCVLAGGTPPAESVAPVQSTVASGVVAYATPPQGFNPLVASDDQIARYGYPPRPDPRVAPDAYAHWHKMVTASQKRVSPRVQGTNLYNGPAEYVAESQTAPLTDSTVENGATVSITSSNWSGYVVTAPSGTFKKNNAWVFAEWAVPYARQAFGSCTGSWDYSSQWVGLDGFGSGDVLQAGTEADAYCSGSTKATYYAAWYEWYGFPETRISFPVNAGDLMGVEVWYTTSAPYGHAYLVNYTRQASTVVGFNPPAGTSLVGNSMEWVVERPSVGGSPATLTNYVAASFNFTYGYANGTYYYPGSTPAGDTIYNVSMYSGSSEISYVNLYGFDTMLFFDTGPAS